MHVEHGAEILPQFTLGESLLFVRNTTAYDLHLSQDATVAPPGKTGNITVCYSAKSDGKQKTPAGTHQINAAAMLGL
jgi:hypothetical protein